MPCTPCSLAQKRDCSAAKRHQALRAGNKLVSQDIIGTLYSKYWTRQGRHPLAEIRESPANARADLLDCLALTLPGCCVFAVRSPSRTPIPACRFLHGACAGRAACIRTAARMPSGSPGCAAGLRTHAEVLLEAAGRQRVRQVYPLPGAPPAQQQGNALLTAPACTHASE